MQSPRSSPKTSNEPTYIEGRSPAFIVSASVAAAFMLAGCGASDDERASSTRGDQADRLTAEDVYAAFSPSCQYSVDDLASSGRGFADAVEEVSQDNFGIATGFRNGCDNPYTVPGNDEVETMSPSELDATWADRQAPSASDTEEPKPSEQSSQTATEVTESECGAVTGEGTPREITTSGLTCYGAKRLALAATLDPAHDGCAVSNESGTRVVLREPCTIGDFDCQTIGAYQTDSSRGECTSPRGERIGFVFG